MDLVTFLRARFDEDEAAANAATPGPWRVDDPTYAEAIYGAREDNSAVIAGGRWGGEASVFDETADALHIVRHDPARVRREIAARRRLLKLHAPPSYDDTVTPEHVIDDGSGFHECQTERGLESFFDKHFCPVMRLLALPYDTHPDYDPEWKPQD